MPGLLWSATVLSRATDLDVIRKSLHSSSSYTRAVATGRLNDLALAGRVPRTFTPEVLRLLDTYWDTKGCFLVLQTLDAMGGEEAIAGFDTRLAAAAADLVTSDDWLAKTLDINIIEDVRSRISQERRSYDPVCLALSYIVLRPAQAGLSHPGTRSENPSALQQAKAFAILQEICPALAGDEIFDQDANRMNLQIAALSSRILPAIANWTAGATVGAVGHATAGPAGQIAAKTTWKGLRKFIANGAGADQPVLRTGTSGAGLSHHPASDKPDMPSATGLSQAEMLTWLKTQVELLAQEITHPGVATRRAGWRNG